MSDFKDVIINFEFDNDCNTALGHFKDARYDDPAYLEFIIGFEQFEGFDTSAIQIALAAHRGQVTYMPKDTLKEVFVMLKDRSIHPKGKFDDTGRFYIYDRDIIDVVVPSIIADPFHEMNVGRTAKFVRAIAEKYKAYDIEDLLRLFDK